MFVQVLAAMAAAQAVPSSQAPSLLPTSAAPQPACSDAEHHQFDFWVGKWDVYGPKGRLVAHSLIEPVYGCGIRENWMPFSNQPGGSLSVYVPAEKRWEQFWIDSAGSRVVFTGGWNGSAMIISGEWPTSPSDKTGPITRMTYTKNADGSVRQFGDQSTDNGSSWKPAFDYTYRRAAESASK